MKKKIGHNFQLSLTFASIISVCSAHTIVEQKCSSELIYTFNSSNFEHGKIQQIETENYFINIVHFERSVSYAHHQVGIIKKSHPNRLSTYTFEGIAFEIVSLELDKHAHGEEFLVTDKPSARGYRYSVLPSPLSVLENDLKANKLLQNSERNILSFWSLPESYHPMFSDINNDGICEIINFTEKFQREFMYPKWHVGPTIYSFDSLSGQAKLNKSLNTKYYNTLWKDQEYKFNQITNLIKSSNSIDEFYSKMPEFDPGIPATKFLYIAKKVKKFDIALVSLETLLSEYRSLRNQDELFAPPVFFHLTSGFKFSEFESLSKRASIFTKEELHKIYPIFAMVAVKVSKSWTQIKSDLIKILSIDSRFLIALVETYQYPPTITL